MYNFLHKCTMLISEALDVMYGTFCQLPNSTCTSMCVRNSRISIPFSSVLYSLYPTISLTLPYLFQCQMMSEELLPVSPVMHQNHRYPRHMVIYWDVCHIHLHNVCLTVYIHSHWSCNNSTG